MQVKTFGVVASVVDPGRGWRLGAETWWNNSGIHCSVICGAWVWKLRKKCRAMDGVDGERMYKDLLELKR